jgi:N utilization substance protein A
MNNFKISFILDELAEEKGMQRDMLVQAVIEGILAAYIKRYPGMEFSANYDKKADNLTVLVKKKVVTDLYDKDIEITYKKAQLIKQDVELDEELWVPFDGSIGRIEISKARQIIAQKIKSIEAEAVYKEFSSKVGTIMNGTVHKVDPFGAFILLYGVVGYLSRRNMIPDEKLIPGMAIRTLVQDVLVEAKNDSQLVLDRASTGFIKKLLELEIPEIFDGIVIIEKIVRIPGYKSKVLVSSKDSHIDPLGTCIGAGGSRIKPILKELGSERIDIIPMVKNQEEQIAYALKPGIVESVRLSGDVAYIEVLPENRSIIIGKGGRNISLASDLTEVTIELNQDDNGDFNRASNDINSRQID